VTLPFQTNFHRDRYFEHLLLPTKELETEYVDGKRFYVTPTGEKYPSVTTVLSSLTKEGITEWVERVGVEQANKIRTQAATRGTKVHSICEDYIRNVDNYFSGHMPSNVMMFKQIQPYLDEHLDRVYGIEIPLYSHTLKTAGRCDLVGRLHGITSILDYKTSTKPKNKEWIENYFIQATVYAMMIEEMYGFKVPQIAIAIAVEEGDLQTFVESSNTRREKATQIFKQYTLNNS